MITCPAGLNTITMLEPSSVHQMLSFLSMRTVWANTKPYRPWPISRTNLPSAANSNRRVWPLRVYTKMRPLEFTATPAASPRYVPAGSWRRWGAELDGKALRNSWNLAVLDDGEIKVHQARSNDGVAT